MRIVLSPKVWREIVPRKPRFYLPNIPVHIVQRGHSREPVFFETADYQAYLHWLKEASVRYECQIHAYVLMTNHIHILTTPKNTNSISLMMQYLGRQYVPYINYKYGTSGSIWEGRYKANMIQEDDYLLSCMRYIELNPVRANMVKSPGAYQWSSYHANGLGKVNALVQSHYLYHSLGKTLKKRLNTYTSLFKAHFDKEEIDSIRSSCQSGTPLGNDSFKQKIEKKLKCKTGQLRRGRPRVNEAY